jgi:hypothetical protein
MDMRTAHLNAKTIPNSFKILLPAFKVDNLIGLIVCSDLGTTIFAALMEHCHISK